MRTAARVDANQSEIVADLRSVPGCKVLILSAVGKGCPDILVGFHGRLSLIEIKDGSKSPSRRKLTPDEKKFHKQWEHLPVFIAKNTEEAFTAAGISLESAPF